jgi:hypothetical protein
LNWSTCEDKSDSRNSELDIAKKKLRSKPSSRYRTSPNALLSTDTSHLSKRRISAQVTRMLLAVTLSLILFNIPNTAIFLFTKITNTRRLLDGSCEDVSNANIKLYKIGFYSSVIQDILSDLPHIVNFFLYCLAGKKFRSIILEEVNRFLVHIHIIKRKQRNSNQTSHVTIQDLTYSTGTNHSPRRASTRTGLSQSQRTSNVLFNGTTSKVLVCQQDYDTSLDENAKYNQDHVIHMYSALH